MSQSDENLSEDKLEQRKHIIQYLLKHRKPKLHTSKIASDLEIVEEEVKETLLSIQKEFPETGELEYGTGWFIQFGKDTEAKAGSDKRRAIPWILLLASIIVLIGGLTILEEVKWIMTVFGVSLITIGISIRWIMKQSTYVFPEKKKSQKEALIQAYIAQTGITHRNYSKHW